MYVEVMKDVCKRNQKDKKKSAESILREINETDKSLISLEDKWTKGGVGDDTFDRINKRYNEKLRELRYELAETESRKESLAPYISGAINVVENIKKMFVQGDYEMKQSILSSIFPEKLILSKDECRTTKLNSVVELLTRFNKACEKLGNKKADISVGLSTLAPPQGLEPWTL